MRRRFAEWDEDTARISRAEFWKKFKECQGDIYEFLLRYPHETIRQKVRLPSIDNDLYYDNPPPDYTTEYLVWMEVRDHARAYLSARTKWRQLKRQLARSLSRAGLPNELAHPIIALVYKSAIHPVAVEHGLSW